MTLFKPNGGAPSLNQVVQLAQYHVTPKSRRRAREIDDEIYSDKPAKKTYKRKPSKVSRFERINAKYESKFYNN